MTVSLPQSDRCRELPFARLLRTQGKSKTAAIEYRNAAMVSGPAWAKAILTPTNDDPQMAATSIISAMGKIRSEKGVRVMALGEFMSKSYRLHPASTTNHSFLSVQAAVMVSLECAMSYQRYEESRLLRSSMSPNRTAKPEPAPIPIAMLLSAIPRAMPTATPMMMPNGNARVADLSVMDSV